MKIIVVDSLAPATFEVIADSAVTLPGRPMFLPDIPEVDSWVALPLLGVRLCRLGKTVGEKFAPRYFDACTVAFRLLPLDSSGQVVKGVAAVIDSGLMLGQWDAFPEGNSLAIDACGECIDFPVGQISRAISTLSLYATLKMGDVLLFPLRLPLTPASIGTTLSASINSRPLTAVRLK